MPARWQAIAHSTRARHHLARLAAGEEVDRPGGVARRGLGEVALQRVDLGERRGARVELGEEAREALHAPASRIGAPTRRRRDRRRFGRARRHSLRRSSSSSPYSVANALASQALLAQPAHHHRFVAVRDDDALGAGRLDRALQAGPVGVVAEHEAAVDRAAPARAAQLHPAARERVAVARRSGASTSSPAPTAARRSARAGRAPCPSPR